MADVITRLKLDSGEYDSKIKRAAQGLLQMEQECRKVNGTLAILEKDQKQFVQSLGSMQTVSTSVRGKIGELTGAYTELRAQYNRLTAEEKKGDFGRALSQSLDQLKGRVNDAKKELADINKELAGGGKFGEFGNVIDTMGSKLGVTGNLTEMLTSKTAMLTGAVGAGIAIVTKATEAWAGYNSELAKQDQITTVTTGLKGDDADRMTDKMRALSDTYNVDFREAVNAANTLMTQFGKSGDEATQLIKDGMQGMIQGDGPKLLSMIQQYAPAFRDAGVSASQLVAVIQNSEGGIFTDQNMNAIVMGIKNIRLMTKATSDALAQLGIDGEKMSKQLSDGSLTVFDALKQVARQLQTVDSNSKTAGEVMQQVFGRQGVTAGTNLAKAIETLNTDLEETKKQTGELGDALADLQTANEKLNKAIRDCFEYDGWDQMAAGIRSNLITALAGVLEKLAAIKTELRDLFNGNSLTDWLKGKLNAGQNGNNPKLGLGGMNWHAQNTGPQGSYTVVTDKNGKVISTQHQDLTTPQPTRTVNPRRTTGGKNGKTTNVPTYAADSIAAQQALVSELMKKWNEASQDMQQGYVAQLVEAEAKLKQMKDDAQWMKDLAAGKYSLQDYHFKEGMQGAMTERGAESLRFSPKFEENMKDSIAVKAPLQLDDKAMKALSNQIKAATKPQKEEKISVSNMMGQLAGGLNSIDSGLSQLGLDLGDGFRSVVSGITAVTTILSGISALVTIITTIQGTKAVPVIGWALANGGVIHAASGYTVPGNNYSGDMVPAMLNSGELVLNRAQQGNLASQLSGGGMQNIQLSAVIRGDQLMLVQNNRGMRTGKGELVQSYNRR